MYGFADSNYPRERNVVQADLDKLPAETDAGV